MNVSKTRVKIPRLTLIERIQERIDDATRTHDDAAAQYEKEVGEFLASLPAAIERRAKEISKLKGEEAEKFVAAMRQSRDWNEGVWISVEVEKIPRRSDADAYQYTKGNRGYYYDREDFKGYIAELTKAKKVLEASTDEFISVAATDQYADWL